jgi:hypothetical protein
VFMSAIVVAGSVPDHGPQCPKSTCPISHS